ncbi:hypothetical protein [Hymenobacter glacieicola]|uniref:Uncharacterized protein n=1 Tax=Hymenobacter glacieicola TaxID=1562124 RepID=A0ABQ1X3Q7_9BACT|nr:hypothetical protein [Hymenobacter glacieicola]GGG58390.1 hypothetical protein GCM10011378_38170 [Hymenobacter glacieicola]
MLVRLLCIISMLAAGAAAASGQALPAATTSPVPAAVPATVATTALTRADTARAVHELFRSRRGGGFGWLALGSAGMLASILPAQQSTSAGVWTPGVVAGTAFVGIGLNKRIQFRRSRERLVLRELAATGHLPISISRRLKGNFLPVHGTASDHNPLLAKGVVPAGPARSTPAPTPAQALADAQLDTLDAVQGLFNAKRLGGQLPILLALPGLRLMTGSDAGSNSTSPYGPTQSSEPSGGQVAAGLFLTAGGLTYMLLHNAPYSDAKFAELRASYLAGKPLPPALRARLKEKHVASGRAYRARLERKAARRR